MIIYNIILTFPLKVKIAFQCEFRVNKLTLPYEPSPLRPYGSTGLRIRFLVEKKFFPPEEKMAPSRIDIPCSPEARGGRC